MDKMPFEILCDIFLNVDDLGRNRFASITVPLCVSQVCHRWREVSLSCGELWSYLALWFDLDICVHDATRYTGAASSIFETWLQRTAECPLNFDITIRNNYCAQNEDVRCLAEHIITELLFQQHRWREVRFDWRFIPSPDFPDIVASNMPKLTFLSLVWAPFMTQPDDKVGFAYVDISRSPNLRYLDVNGRFTLHRGISTPNDSLEICYLEFCDDAINEQAAQACWKILEVASNIEIFHATFTKLVSPFSPWPEVRLHLPEEQSLLRRKLRKLHLKARSVSVSLLEKLTLPALKDLWCETYASRRGGEALLGLIRRSMPSLRTMELHGDGTDEDTLIPVLHLLPTLERLFIASARVSSRVFEELNVTYGHVLCPALAVITFEGLEVTEDFCSTIDAFVAMATSWWNFDRSSTCVWINYINAEVHLPLIPGPSYELLETYFGDSITVNRCVRDLVAVDESP